jgi:hypothetical protein
MLQTFFLLFFCVPKRQNLGSHSILFSSYVMIHVRSGVADCANLHGSVCVGAGAGGEERHGGDNDDATNSTS